MTLIRSLFLSLAVLAGCAPPPQPEGAAGDPEIRLLYPPRDADVLPLDAEGRLSFLVVADVNSLEFVPPADDAVDVEGQGHFHLTLNEVYVAAPSAQFFQYTSEPEEFSVGQGLSVRVSLASNTHLDLDASASWEDVAEYTVGAAPTP